MDSFSINILQNICGRCAERYVIGDPTKTLADVPFPNTSNRMRSNTTTKPE